MTGRCRSVDDDATGFYCPDCVVGGDVDVGDGLTCVSARAAVELGAMAPSSGDLSRGTTEWGFSTR